MDDLEKILERVRELEDTDDDAEQSKSQGGAWGWIVGIVLALVVTVGVGLLVWKLNRKNKELAKLRTESEINEVKLEQTEFKTDVSKSETRIKELKEKAADLRGEIQADSVVYNSRKQKLDEAISRLKKIRSWADLDEHNKKGRP